MAGKPDRQALKQQAIQALDLARHSLRGGWVEAREHLRPANFIRQSVARHQVAVLVSALAAGALATRWVAGFFRGASPSATTTTTKKRSLTGLLLGGLWGIAREPLIALASQRVLPVIMRYASQFQPPSKNSNPE